MIKLALNRKKFNNYAFFCPVSRLHLTVSNPVGYTNEVTPAILRAVKLETLIDVDGVINLETGAVENKPATAVPVEEPKSSEQEVPNGNSNEEGNTPEQEEAVAEPASAEEAPVEEVPKAAKKGGKKSAKETTVTADAE